MKKPKKEQYYIIDKVDGVIHCLSGDQSFYLINVTKQIEEWKEKAWMYDDLCK